MERRFTQMKQINDKEKKFNKDRKDKNLVLPQSISRPIRIAFLKRIFAGQPAKAGDRIIAIAIQKHHKPLKAVTESLLDFSIIALSPLTGFSSVLMSML